MSVDYLEYLTGNEQIAYPFKEDSDGLVDHGGSYVHGASAKVPRDFLIDAVILTPTPFHSQVYLDHIEATGGGYEFHLYSEEQRAVAVFSVSGSPPARSILTFQDATTKVTIRLLTGTNFMSYLSGTTLDEFELRLPFEVATVEIRPQRVEKLVHDVTSEEAEGTVIFLPGNNVEYSVDTSLSALEGGNLDVTEIEINAVPGIGLGRGNPCTPDRCEIDYIATINGVEPDEDGNVTINPGACHRLSLAPPTNSIFLYNDCKPCCECEDYEAAVNVLGRLFDQLKTTVLDVVNDTEADHNYHVTVYNRDIFTQLRGVFVSGVGMKGVVKGVDSLEEPKSNNWATLVVRINNRGCVELTGLTATITLAPADYAVFQSSVKYQNQTATDVHTGPNPVVVNFSPLVPGSEISIYLLLKRPWPEEASGSAVVVVTWDPVWPGDPATSSPITITW